MAATETRTRPLVPPTPNPRRAPIPTELAALRDVLLAPEQAALKAMQDRLSDPATRAADIAESLPAALAIASADAAELVEHLVCEASVDPHQVEGRPTHPGGGQLGIEDEGHADRTTAPLRRRSPVRADG